MGSVDDTMTWSHFVNTYPYNYAADAVYLSLNFTQSAPSRPSKICACQCLSADVKRCFKVGMACRKNRRPSGL